MSVQNYRLKCRNTKCGYDTVKRWNKDEFDTLVNSGSTPGISCLKCSYPRMEVQKSHRNISDGFVPGFQRSIRKYCSTYGEYKRYLKEMGLIELGYDDFPEPPKEESNYFKNDAICKKLQEQGFSGQQIAALKRGEKLSNPEQLKENIKKLDEYAKNLD